MQLIRLTIIALLLGAYSGYAVYAQPPGYDPRDRDRDRYHDRDHDNDWDDYYDGYDLPRPWEEVGFFYDELTPYGDWVMTRDYGWAWFPRDVHPYWRPYTEGRWVITDYGWTWISYEPFGWATYHYGRWTRDERIGWLWVPGTDWGPAWVSWQHGGGYVGWAPLPPSVDFEVGFGIRLGNVDLNVALRPDVYNFVPERSFLDSRLSGHVVPRTRNSTLIHSTTNVTKYSVVENRVVNRGVETERIEKAVGRRLRPFRISRNTAKTKTELGETEVRIYRPEQQKVDTLRDRRRASAEVRAQRRAEREKNRPPGAQRREPPEIAIAPRNDRTPGPSPEQLERRARREQEELRQFQEEEKRRVEKLQQQELSNAREQAQRERLQRQQQAEKEALREEQRKSQQQLEERQKARREATRVKPREEANPPGREKAAEAEREKKSGKEKASEREREREEREKKRRQNPPPKSGGGGG